MFVFILFKIVHLKRFNCVNNKWVKSQKVVHFPFDNFDPTPYLAAVPQETILRHKELLEMNEISQPLKEITENDDIPISDKALETQTPTTATTPSPNNGNTTTNNTTASLKPLNGLTKEAQLSLNDQVNNLLNLQNQHTQILDNCSNIVVDNTKTTTTNSSSKTNNDYSSKLNNVLNVDDNDDLDESSDKILDNDSIMANTLRMDKDGDRTMTRRKRLISTSLTKTPIIDGEFEDYHQHKLKNGEDKFDPKYKLYAVVVSYLFKF